MAFGFLRAVKFALKAWEGLAIRVYTQGRVFDEFSAGFVCILGGVINPWDAFTKFKSTESYDIVRHLAEAHLASRHLLMCHHTWRTDTQDHRPRIIGQPVSSAAGGVVK